MNPRRVRPSLAFCSLVVAACAIATASAQRSRPQFGPHDLVHREFDARVVRVADGDTLDVTIRSGTELQGFSPGQNPTRRVRVRLEGIDAPEQGEPFSRQALAYVRTLIFDREVRVRGRDVDRYDRLVARIVHDDADVSAALVRAGLACHAYAYDAALAREEAQARAAGAGFWAASAPKPRCVTTTAFSARGKTGATRSPSASGRLPALHHGEAPLSFRSTRGVASMTRRRPATTTVRTARRCAADTRTHRR